MESEGKKKIQKVSKEQEEIKREM